MATDVAKALMAMHNRVPPRIHCDLKAANCFVDSQWNAYIGDFGFTRAVWSRISLGPTNPRWLSPEINLNASFTEASDVYAFGMLLWELLVWEPPLRAHTRRGSLQSCCRRCEAGHPARTGSPW